MAPKKSYERSSSARSSPEVRSLEPATNGPISDPSGGMIWSTRRAVSQHCVGKPRDSTLPMHQRRVHSASCRQCASWSWLFEGLGESRNSFHGVTHDTRYSVVLARPRLVKNRPYIRLPQRPGEQRHDTRSLLAFCRRAHGHFRYLRRAEGIRDAMRFCPFCSCFHHEVPFVRLTGRELTGRAGYQADACVRL